MKKVDAGATKGLVKARRPAQVHEAAGRPENSLLRLQQGLGNRAMGELLGGLQCQPEEEEEPTQGKADLQRQGPEEEEEPPQGKLDLQAQEEVQTKSPEGEEEEEAGEEEEFEEEALQGKADLQRQGPEEEEEVPQGKPDLQAQEEEPEEEEEEPVQGKADASSVPPQVMRAIDSRRGGGQQLEGSVRQSAEQAFGFEFRDVRVHTDSEADGLARGLRAKAFTTGKDIFFRSKDYDPHSAAGRELIGHELTHVVQQHQGLSEPAGRPGDRYEQEADRMAAAAFGREAVPVAGVQGKAEGLQAELQRQSEPEEEEELQPQVQAQEEIPEEEV